MSSTVLLQKIGLYKDVGLEHISKCFSWEIDFT